MKRKLALLLAGTMVLSTVSTSTIFAANGELALKTPIVTTTKDTTTASAIITDKTQSIPKSGAFTFELVNGKFNANSGSVAGFAATDAVVTTTETTMNVLFNREVLAEETPELEFSYKAIDDSKPTYLKVTYSNVTGYTGKEIQLSQVSASQVKYTVNAAKQETLSLAADGSVVINSTLKGGVKKGTYKLTLPTGYTWGDVAKVTGTYGNGTVIATTAFTSTKSDDNKVLTVVIGDDFNEDGNVFGSSITVGNLDVVNANNVYNQEVIVTVKNEKSETVTTGKIASFNTYGVTATVGTAVADLKTFTSGKNYEAGKNVSATIKINESVAGSYRGGNFVITLPEGVTIKAVPTLKDANGVCIELSVAEMKDNKVTIAGAKGNASLNKGFALEVQLDLVAKTEFEGEVTATVTAPTNTLDFPAPIVAGAIAKFATPFEVTTEVTEVEVGKTNQPTADIVITEKVAGTFGVGTVFDLALDTTKYSGGYMLSGADFEVTNGTVAKNADQTTSTASIKITSVEDITKPMTITFKNVKVSSNRYVPTFVDDAVKVTVTASGYSAFSTDYVKFVSELSKVEEIIETPAEIYNSDVKITLGGNTATLADGTKVELYGTPYVSADGNYMLPVKGFGFALGLDAADIVYDPAEKMATFFLEDGKSIAQIQNGSSYVVVDGVRKPLIDANGSLVAPVVKDGRFYLPLRACGTTMFGVDVAYNAADKSVVVNPSK